MIISPKCIIELRTKYRSLSPKVRRVADYIIQHPDLVIGSSIQNLAEQVGVSQYTILNCVRAIGYKGYSDFRLDLAMNTQNIGSDAVSNRSAEIADPADQGVYRHLSETYERGARCLLDTMQLIEPNAFINFVNRIFLAKRTAIYGLGSSSYAAQYLCLQLVRLGLHAVAVTEVSYQILDSVTLIENDLLIGFSASGAASSIIESFHRAKQSNCYTIAVTSVSDSELALAADEVFLLTSSGPRHAADTENAIIEQISLASAISAAVYDQMQQGRTRTI